MDIRQGRMGKTYKVAINEADELDIRCLLADLDSCPYRYRLFWHFGRKIKSQCPHRKTLRRLFEKWQALRENKKDAEEYPDG